MFATPEDINALQDYVAQFSGGEAAAANVVMGMTWNLAVTLFNKRLEEQDNE